MLACRLVRSKLVQSKMGYSIRLRFTSGLSVVFKYDHINYIAIRINYKKQNTEILNKYILIYIYLHNK